MTKAQLAALIPIAERFDCPLRGVELLAREKWGELTAYVPEYGAKFSTPLHDKPRKKVERGEVWRGRNLVLMDLDWTEGGA